MKRSKKGDYDNTLAIKYEILHLDVKLRNIKANRDKLVHLLKEMEA
jgi:hypothetical protein